MLDDKVVVITGGAGLLGKEFARSVILHGGRAVIADLDEERGHLTASELSGEGEVLFLPVDITSAKSIRFMINEIQRICGKIDGVVSNAYPRNAAYGHKFFDVKPEDFNDNVSRHLGGYFNTAQEFSRFFIEQGYGNIVMIGSIYGVVAPRFGIYTDTEMTMPVEYSVIKSGVIHLCRYMARFLAGKNIRVNCLSPGGISNNQPASFIEAYRDECLQKGMLDPIDLTGTLAFLLSDNSRYINGQNLVVDDGFTL